MNLIETLEYELNLLLHVKLSAKYEKLNDADKIQMMLVMIEKLKDILEDN